jgi:hypothetical protein
VPYRFHFSADFAAVNLYFILHIAMIVYVRADYFHIMKVPYLDLLSKTREELSWSHF